MNLAAQRHAWEHLTGRQKEPLAEVIDWKGDGGCRLPPYQHLGLAGYACEVLGHYLWGIAPPVNFLTCN